MFKLNKNIEVKTPDGFKSFSGIQKVYKPFYYKYLNINDI